MKIINDIWMRDIPEEEYECLAVKSLGLLKDLLEKKSFHNEGSLENRTKKYEDKSNPLEKFFKEFVEEDSDGFIWKFEFEKKLNEWCSDNKFRSFSGTSIGIKMKELKMETIQRMSEWLIDGRNKLLRAWAGIKWK